MRMRLVYKGIWGVWFKSSDGLQVVGKKRC